MMYASTPRTVSHRFTDISPSLNLLTVDLPRGLPIIDAISSASSGFEFPEKILKSANAPFFIVLILSLCAISSFSSEFHVSLPNPE